MPFNKICNVVDCGNLVEGRTEMCATHNHEQRKIDKQSKKVQIVVPVKKITAKRAKQVKDYTVLRDEYLIAFPICEVNGCKKPATEVHHRGGRENEKLLDTSRFMSVCEPHHKEITEFSRQAIQAGYSELRTVTDKTI